MQIVKQTAQFKLHFTIYEFHCTRSKLLKHMASANKESFSPLTCN